jgi:hypothetical protein
MKINKINKMVLSLLMLAVMLFSVNIHVLAGGENKIETLSNGDKLIYISTESIPDVINLIQQEIDRQEGRKFSTLSNVLFKVIVAVAGGAICCAASKIDNTGGAAAVSVSTILLDIPAFFLPEYISSNSNYHIENAEPYICKVGHLNSQIGDCGFGLVRLLMALKQICPHYWNYHFTDEYPHYPNVYDGNYGVIMHVFHGQLSTKGNVRMICFSSQSESAYKMLELSEVDKHTNRYLKLMPCDPNLRASVIKTSQLIISGSLINEIYG